MAVLIESHKSTPTHQQHFSKTDFFFFVRYKEICFLSSQMTVSWPTSCAVAFSIIAGVLVSGHPTLSDLQGSMPEPFG